MDNTFEMISVQTGIDDLLLIEKTYYECGSKDIDTICKLMNLKQIPKIEKEKTIADNLREILDEKEAIYQQFMQNIKNT